MKAIDYAEQAHHIFVLSDSFLHIKDLMENNNATMDDIADVILLDPALSVAILKLANSAFYNHSGKVDTISKALLILGMRDVYHLVISYFTSNAVTSLALDEAYLESFWECSVDCALLMKFIGKHLKIAQPERLFIVGLLHNLGELVVKQYLSSEFDLHPTQHAEQLPWRKQQEVLGFTFGECTAELLNLWQLPESIIRPVQEQDNHDFSTLSKEGQLLFLAKRVMLKNTFYPEVDVSAFIEPTILESLHITEDIIEDAIRYCDQERFSILFALKPSTMMLY